MRRMGKKIRSNGYFMLNLEDIVYAMKLSIFSDELGYDIRKALPILKSWGYEFIDLRALIFNKPFEGLTPEEMKALQNMLKDHGLQVAVLQSSLAKVHLPDQERQQAEKKKLEAIIRASEIFDCNIVRSFHYWQPGHGELRGELSRRADELQKVLDLFGPLADRAAEAGLILGFENCGVEPDEVVSVLDALGHDHWGLAWDAFNTWNSDERRKDENGYIRRMLMRANMLHVKANGAIPEMEKDIIPYDKILAAAHVIGKVHAVSVETHAREAKEEVSRKVTKRIQKDWPSAAPGSLEDALSDKKPTIERAWKDDPVTFVVVGLGMGRNRAKMIQETSGCKLLGVCDLREDLARRTAQDFDVPYETDVQKWLEKPEVEVVYVVTETGNHAAVAEQALLTGKHVITTKPMEANLAAAKSVVLAARKADRALAVDFSRRFTPGITALKSAIDQEIFGRLLFVSASLTIKRTADYFAENGGWRGTRKLDGGGVLSNQAIHVIDELAYVLGIPKRVRCDTWTQVHAIEAEDLGVAVWEYENGLVVNLTATSTYPQNTWYPRIELHGTQGGYSSFSGGAHERPRTLWHLGESWSDEDPVDDEPRWKNSADNLAAHLRSEAPLIASGEDGWRTQSILEAMYQSALDGHGAWVATADELDLA